MGKKDLDLTSLEKIFSRVFKSVHCCNHKSVGVRDVANIIYVILYNISLHCTVELTVFLPQILSRALMTAMFRINSI